MTVSIDGQVVGRGNAGGPLVSQPSDGLQVGRGAKGAVGKYDAPFVFTGKVSRVEIVVD